MSIQQVRRLPVINGKDKLVGMITQTDLATHIDNRLTGAMVEEISQD